jgi:steroid delta-isomerase-like uncharacterized protein
MTTRHDYKAIVTRFFNALNNDDMDAILAIYADDGCVQTMGNTLISGVRTREQIAAFADGILDAFPQGLQFTVHGMVAEGDKVAVEAESRGTHVSGKVYRNDYHFLFEFRDGRLLRLKEYLDTEPVTDILCGGQRPPQNA